MFMSLVRRLVALFRTFSALFIGFYVTFGILWKSYGHQNNQGVNLVKVQYSYKLRPQHEFGLNVINLQFFGGKLISFFFTSTSGARHDDR